MSLTKLVINSGQLTILSGSKEIINSNGVYSITCLENKFVYYGSCASLFGFARRLRLHINELKKETHHNWKLQRDWNKFGESKFLIEILELCSPQNCRQIEQEYIDSATFSKLDIYNIDLNPSKFGLYRGMAETTKEKISIALKGKKKPADFIEKLRLRGLGKKLSDSTRAKISEANRRRVMSESHKQKLINSRKGKLNSEEHKRKISLANQSPEKKEFIASLGRAKKGIKLSQSFCDQMSAARKGKPNPKTSQALKGRKIPLEVIQKRVDKAAKNYIIFSPNGDWEVIKNLAEYCRKSDGLDPSSLRSVAKGKLRQCCGGWRCYYATPENLEKAKNNDLKMPPIKKPSEEVIESRLLAAKRGVVKALAKEWLVTDPGGNTTKVINLSQFCREQGLEMSGMSAVASGCQKKHRGWKCRHFESVISEEV